MSPMKSSEATSERAYPPHRQRVLQVDYADFDLPGGLAWLGFDGGTKI